MDRRTLSTHGAVPSLGLLLPPLATRRRRTTGNRRSGRGSSGVRCWSRGRSPCSCRVPLGSRAVLPPSDLAARTEFDHAHGTFSADHQVSARQQHHVSWRRQAYDALVRCGRVRVFSAGRRVRSGLVLRRRRKTVDLLQQERVCANLQSDSASLRSVDKLTSASRRTTLTTQTRFPPCPGGPVDPASGTHIPVTRMCVSCALRRLSGWPVCERSPLQRMMVTHPPVQQLRCG